MSDSTRKHIEKIVDILYSDANSKVCKELLAAVDDLIYEMTEEMNKAVQEVSDKSYDEGHTKGYEDGQSNYLNDIVGNH